MGRYDVNTELFYRLLLAKIIFSVFVIDYSIIQSLLQDNGVLKLYA